MSKGKCVMWKLLLQEHIYLSPIFDQAKGRVESVHKLTTCRLGEAPSKKIQGLNNIQASI
ncbi:hypothetical protein PSHT_11785 [Puccinia striiformis]|uniref:Uncharacterized protein n=2 Tax=Puccinia striiformis TaxID=27350 RepID=A0A2S4V156_9BASI|nr:hypothetical protein PSTT_13682 [Puccinia striiformis]POW03257.1 hypothetical protein PSHT_11785 [Puccinia striiformis]